MLQLAEALEVEPASKRQAINPLVDLTTETDGDEGEHTSAIKGKGQCANRAQTCC